MMFHKLGASSDQFKAVATNRMELMGDCIREFMTSYKYVLYWWFMTYRTDTYTYIILCYYSRFMLLEFNFF